MTRTVSVHALAKINFSLEILNRRSDGFHNIRTLFQTISLADEIGITYETAPQTDIHIDSDIPDNLMVRAAAMVLEELRLTARVQFQLRKHIPMGAGLGGGSSDAAAVLLALPALAARPIRFERLLQLAAQIGSDVPFFLVGGTALGLSRGEELYPVADARYDLVIAAPDVHNSTVDAYRALGRTPDYVPAGNAARDFLLTGDPEHWVNDFQELAFAAQPSLGALRDALITAGLRHVRMTGSGSAIFGITSHPDSLDAIAEYAAPAKILQVHAVNRLRYRALWWRQLGEYVQEGTWPPLPR